jgi:hypothetical protein
MSAWYVLSAMGFYSVTPGQDVYVIGSPLFERVTLRLPNGRRFRISARDASRSRPYIQSATFEDKTFDRCFLRHAEIMAGGELAFAMGAEPNRAWGSGAGAKPESRAVGEHLVAVPYVASGANPFRDSTSVVLALPGPARARITYTLDGTEPVSSSPSYVSPLRLDRTQTLRFRAILEGDSTAWTAVQECMFRKIEGNRHVVLGVPPHRAYTAGGNDALIDGVRGGDDFRLGTWQGFYGVDLDAVVDLGTPIEIGKLGTGFLQDQNSWIFMPLSVRFELSQDGQSWQPAGEVTNGVDPHADGVVLKDFQVEVRPARKARWVRVHAQAPVLCPDWHKGAGNRSFIFADEILIE